MRMELSFEEYKTLTEQAPILIWRSATTKECDYFNERWLAFTGRTMEQERGSGWAEGVHPEDLARCLKIYLDSFEQREIFEMEYRLRRHDGVYRWIFDRGAPFFDQDGTFAGYIGSCTDITEQVEARAALLKAKENEIRKLRNLLPICSYCKKVREDSGYWEDVETYLMEHSDTVFSHGICPDCLRKHFSDYVGEKSAEE
jgi:PAS domain S-box-containing protein